jgi:thioredoxin 2
MHGADMHIACAHCGATNRVPEDRLGEHPSCGRCGQTLLPGEPVALGDAHFDTVIGRSELPVLVDFWAPWCGPCRMMAPHFEQAAAQWQGRVLFAKVDSDENPRASAQHGIRSIPTLALFVGGRELARQSGAMSAAQLNAWLDQALQRR